MTLCNLPPAPAASLPAEGPQAATRSPGSNGHRQHVDPALRKAFEHALARRDSATAEDESQPTNAEVLATQAAPVVVPPAVREITRLQPEPEALVFVSSQPVTPATPAPTQIDPTPAGAGAQPMPAVLGSALSALTMPASPEGLQHWQFSFSQAGSVVGGVTLTAQPQAPWLVQVNLHAQSLSSAQWRERGALDARLGELRQRLLGRGAHIDQVELHDPQDPTRHR